MRSCDACQRVAKFPADTELYQTLPRSPFHTLQVDHVGPFVFEGESYHIVTAIDTFSSKAFASWVKTTAAKDVVAFLYFSVWQNFPGIKRIYADNFFSAGVIRRFAEKFGVQLVIGAPYNARAHGKIERFNLSMQEGLERRGLTGPDPVLLAEFVRSFNNTVLRGNANLSPNEVLFGAKDDPEMGSLGVSAKSYYELQQDLRDEFAGKLLEGRVEDVVLPRRPHNIIVGDLVLLKKEMMGAKKKKAAYRNWGPYVVTRVHHLDMVTIRMDNGSNMQVSVRHLVKYRGTHTIRDDLGGVVGNGEEVDPRQEDQSPIRAFPRESRRERVRYQTVFDDDGDFERLLEGGS